MVTDCQQRNLLAQFSAAEARAIRVHKYYLSQAAGYDVGLECAVENWKRYHARSWRNERIRREMEIQRREIEKHKWIESERQGADQGQKAVRDWIDRYAAGWREWCDYQLD